MGLHPQGNHHRRRSSVLTGAQASSQPRLSPVIDEEEWNSARSSPRERDGPRGEEQKPLTAEDTDTSDLSSGDEDSDLDLDPPPSDEDLNDDEETGLTAKQRKKRIHKRKKQRQRLDARIAGAALNPRRLADKNVLKKITINASLISLWYLFSLSISVYNKWMFSKDKVVFPYPLFTTSLHMVVQFTLATLILYLIPSLRPKPPLQNRATTAGDLGGNEKQPIVTKFFYLTRLVPCGSATSLDIGLGNMSLKFISLSFLTMCKSSALAFVLLFAFVFRLEAPSIKLILVIATMTLGVVMMVAGETAFNALGFALVIASAFFSGFRWALTQILLLRHPATSNPFSTLFFLNPIMFVTLIIIAFAIEGPTSVIEGYGKLAEARGAILGTLLLVFPGVLAFCMISAEFALLKRSSVVTLSICGIFKEVLTISAGSLFFDDQLTPINLSGLIVTIASIAAYNYMKVTKMRREAQREAEGRAGRSAANGSQRSRRGLGVRYDEGNEGRENYHSVPYDPATDGATAGNLDVEENVEMVEMDITPTNDVRRSRNALLVRASGNSSASPVEPPSTGPAFPIAPS